MYRNTNANYDLPARSEDLQEALLNIAGVGDSFMIGGRYKGSYRLSHLCFGSTPNDKLILHVSNSRGY